MSKGAVIFAFLVFDWCGKEKDLSIWGLKVPGGKANSYFSSLGLVGDFLQMIVFG